MRNKPWTEGEVRHLVAAGGRKNCYQLARELGRTLKSIRSKRQELKVKGYPIASLEHFGSGWRDPDTLRAMIRKRVYRAMWSEAEEAYLREAKCPLVEQAKHLGRSLEAVRYRRRLLKLARVPSPQWLKRRHEITDLWKAGKSYRQIANEMGITIGSVSGWIHRLRHNEKMAIIKKGRRAPSLPTLKFMENVDGA